MTTEYRQTLIGEIPSEWKVVRLGDKDVCEIRGNKSVDKVKNVAFIPMGLISEQGIFTMYETRSRDDVRSFTYCEPGDLLLAKITPSLENGKQGIVPLHIPGGFALATTEVFPISCIGIERLFLFYVLKHPKFRKVLEHSMTGTTGRQRVSKRAVERLRIPLPPSYEQKRIANILSTVDGVIQRVDEVVAKTERLKKGLVQKLLTEGIGHTDFKEAKIGRIPKDWRVVKLRSVVDGEGDIVAGPFGSNLKVCDYKPHGVPIIRLQNIERNRFINKDIKFISPEKAEELSYHSYKSGDIVLAKLGDPIGKACIVPPSMKAGVVVADVVRIRPSQKKAASLFLEYVLNSSMCFQQLRRQTIGSTRPRVNISQVRDLRIPLPTLDEQQRIADILSTVDHKLGLDRNRKRRLERVKKGLMNDLLSGKARVKVD